MTAIKINAITTAINSMVDGFLSFEQACDAVRAHRAAERLDDATARDYILAALLSKKVAYKAQLTENGRPAQGSALQRAVTRLMRYSSPDYAESAGQAKAQAEELDIPADIMAAAMKLAKLCNEYEGAAKLAATALAKARASI